MLVAAVAHEICCHDVDDDNNRIDDDVLAIAVIHPSFVLVIDCYHCLQFFSANRHWQW